MRLSFLVLMFGLLLSTTGLSKANQVNCKRHKIYCKIVELQPRINKKRAMEISNHLYRGARQAGIDPMVSVAILNQENRFRDVHTYEVERDVKEACHMTSCTKVITLHHEVADMSMVQINIRTAVAYGLDIQRLYNHDLKYAIDSHFLILKDKMKQCEHLGDQAWSCYHSKTPKYRDRYVDLVSRYMSQGK